METKPLAFGIVGFLLGGLVVSIAATLEDDDESAHESSSMSMAAMTADLEDRTGDDFDEAFLVSMVEHHEAAVDMARLAQQHAEHDELVRLSDRIVGAQQTEIDRMQQWYARWGYAG